MLGLFNEKALDLLSTLHRVLDKNRDQKIISRTLEHNSVYKFL